jgi:hypothetical protein
VRADNTRQPAACGDPDRVHLQRLTGRCTSVVGGPAAVALAPTTTAVVPDNNLYRTTVTDVGAVRGWVSLGGATTSRQGIAVFAVGTDGRLHQKTAANRTLVTGWAGWQALP